jgi:hypothetical protein
MLSYNLELAIPMEVWESTPFIGFSPTRRWKPVIPPA